MLVGRPPYHGDDPYAVYDLILNSKIEWPKNIDLVAKDLIKKLLIVDRWGSRLVLGIEYFLKFFSFSFRTKRLGCMKNGIRDIKFHRFFKDVNWSDVYDRKYDVSSFPYLFYLPNQINKYLFLF
jgi:protein kinase X